MFKRCMTIFLVVVLVVGVFLGTMLNAGAAENVSIYDLLDELPMKHVSYTYEDRSSKPPTEESGSVWFSPALLLQDSRVFSGEMAKASVALAMAAYRRNDVKDLLQGMGFDVEEDSGLYDYIYERNENDLTIGFCDYVAFSITHLEVTHPTTNTIYRIYAVPIKGTTENAEWFSNFNIGTGDEHEGFRKASEEVLEYLNKRIDNDQFPDENTIVWLTGHSRGAACANLVAGWLSSPDSNIRQEHVFAYTFACPSVSLNADTSLKNIYNFNNPGDLIPMLPLEKWDYKRYGQTIMLDTSEEQLPNVRQQFSAMRGASYAAEISQENLLTLVEGSFNMRLDEFRESATTQAILTVVAWFMGGKTDATFKEALLKHFGDVPEILWEVTDGFGLKDKLQQLLGINDEYADYLAWLYDAYEDAANMSDAEFAVFCEENADLIEQIEEASGAEILIPASLLSARSILQQMAGDITSITGSIQAAINLVLDDNGNIMDKIGHGHTQITYTVWINSLYYGHQGWMASGKTSFNAAEAGVLSIGDGCFFRCEAMETVNLDAPHIYVGDNAFGQCYSLKTVTLPVDFVQSGSPFAYTDGVETISYTYGRTGVMRDRTGGELTPSHWNTLEYESRYSIHTVNLAEGITHIGDYFLYSGSQIPTVKLPSTLKTIGDCAFHSCTHLTEIDLPDSLVSIGAGVFSECTALTEITLHPGVKSIGEEAFSGCTALQSIEINEDLETIGSSAFANCDSLTTLPKLPAAITTIPDSLFYDCDGLIAVTIPTTVTAIDSEAFKDCSSLTTLTVPDTVTSLGLYVFGDCEALRTVTLPADYDISGVPFFGTTGVTTVRFTPGQSGMVPDRSSDRYAENYYGSTLEYSSRESLQSVDYAPGVTRIGTYAYGFGSTVLRTVTLPATLQSIGDYAFNNCDGLTEVFIPASVTEIGAYAFYDCDGMETLTLPDTNATLGTYAFGSCDGLRTVTLPVDYDFSNNPFAANYANATKGVTTIHYTPGQTGIMPDRSNTSSYDNYYGRTLEHANRSSILTMDFAEGVTYIGNYFCGTGCATLQEVKLPSTLTSIGIRAFSGCTALSGIDFPAGMETLGDYAFNNCDSLQAVTIPASVTAIGDSAFYDCDGMETLTLPDTAVSLGTSAFTACDGLRTVTLPVDHDISNNPFGGGYAYATSGVTTIHYTPGQSGIMPDRSNTSTYSNYYHRTLEYASRDSIQSMDFAEGVVRIGNYFFRGGASALVEVKLPSTLQSIGDYGFYGCTALPGIDLPEGLTSIGSHVFYNCDSFTDLPKLPASLAAISDYAFYGCDGLTELTIPETVTAIGQNAFYDCNSIAELTLPDTTVSLGASAFASCDSLLIVTLPVDYDISKDPFAGNYAYATSGVTTIYYTPGQSGIMPDRTTTSTSSDYYHRTLEYASRNSIQTIRFAEGVVSIGNYLFGNGCATLQEVKLPSTLTSIGDYSFYNCPMLLSIDFPMGLETLGKHTFYNCDSLTELTIPASVTAIGSNAFYDCNSIAELTLPDTKITLGSSTFASCDGLRTVTLPVDYDISNDPFAGNYAYATSGVTTIYYTYGQTGIMTDRSDTSNYSNYYRKTLEYASRNSIQTIRFAEGITHIGNYFFGNGCATLQEVKLPSTLQSIGSYGFYNCTVLPEIDLPEGLTAIGSHVFYNCKGFSSLPQLPASLTTISDYAFYGCDGLTELTIPETVTAIGDRAFYDCNFIVELTLPNTAVSLGASVFAGCDGLRTVTLPVDYDISNDPFAGNYYDAVDTVTTIHFTPGQTGIMKDRSTTSSYSNYYRNTLESASYESIQTVVFAEGITYIGSYALRGLSASPEITFRGNAPEIAANAFYGTTATCYYPSADTTWTADILQNYGGTLTWVPYEIQPLTISAKSFTLSFEDEILVNFYYTVSDLTDVAEHGMLVFYSEPEAVDAAAADAVYQAAAYDAVNDRHMATTAGIAAKEMGDTRYYVAYAKRTDGTYVYSDAYDYSPKKYAMNMLGRDTTSDQQKALCVAMLNYGAAAQEYFGYNTGSLMNSELTAEQQALNIAYDATLFAGAVAADSNKIGSFAATATGFSRKNATVSFESAFCVNYYFTPNCTVSGDMTLYIWTPEAYEAADTLTAENAATVTMAALSDGRYWGQVSGIAAKNLDKTYYVAAVYADADGNTCCTGVIAYSLSRYCMNNANGNMGQLAQATAMYGYYAKLYFTA